MLFSPPLLPPQMLFDSHVLMRASVLAVDGFLDDEIGHCRASAFKVGSKTRWLTQSPRDPSCAKTSDS